MPSVLDTSAMLAVVRGEPGAGIVLVALARQGNTCYAHEVNLCEVFYVLTREVGEEAATLAQRHLLETAGIVPFANPDREFIWEVGRLRARITSERLAASLADCFCVATARHFGCELLTADHREFDPVVAMGLRQVTFIR
jgi:PIN domain nuclease of toxin-antitoxin system